MGTSSAQNYSSDIILRDLDCDGNARQGISVISAKNLTIDGCILRNTGRDTPITFHTDFSGDADGVGGTDSEPFLTSSDAQLTIGDFDGDSKDDILTRGVGTHRRVYRRYSPTNMRFYALSEADTGLPADAYFTSPDATAYPGDYNGDGMADLFVKGYGAWRSVFLGSSTGVFATAFAGDADGAGGTDSEPFLTSSDAQLTIGDFDGDGKDDILTRGVGTHRRIYRKYSTENQRFYALIGASTGLPADAYFTSPDAKVYPGDYNGDGMADLFVKGYGAWRALFLGNSTGAFTTAFASDADGVGGTDSDLYLTSSDAKVLPGDYNGDGVTDLFVIGYQTYRVLYLGTTSGTFICAFCAVSDGDNGLDAEAFFTGPDAQLTIGDFDGDGKDDILTRGVGAQRRIYGRYSEAGNRFYVTAEAATGLPDDSCFVSSDAIVFPCDCNDDGVTDLFVKGYGAYRSLYRPTKILAGAGPHAGIDFEPNSADELLENIVVTDCTFENNSKVDVKFSLGMIQTAPSISMTNCELAGSRYGFYMESNIHGEGVYQISDCTIQNAVRNSIYIENWSTLATGSRTTFRNIEIDNNNPCTSEICILASSPFDTGGVEFDNVDFAVTQTNYLFDLCGFSSSDIVEDISGTISSTPYYAEPILYRNDFYDDVDIR